MSAFVKRPKFLRDFLFLLISCAALFSCSKSNFLYDKVGFDAGTMPADKNPNNPVKVAPDYYYRQQGNYQPNQNMPYQQQYQQQPQQQMQQQPPPQQMQQQQAPQPQTQQYQQQTSYVQMPYQQPQQHQYAPPVYQAPQPGSRFYSNPYAIPPSPYYPNYDADQYYVPPAYYNGLEATHPAESQTMKNNRSY